MAPILESSGGDANRARLHLGDIGSAGRRAGAAPRRSDRIVTRPRGKRHPALVCWQASANAEATDPQAGRPAARGTGAEANRSSPVPAAGLDRPPEPASLTRAPATAPTHRVRLATDPADVRAAQRLRFEVFNEELGEGLDEAWLTGHDEDPFDAVCQHLLVEDCATDRIIGTYRLLPGPVAAASGLGYYSAQEFVFAPFDPYRPLILELGRACVHRDHRNHRVLSLLWRGIAAAARSCGARYLVGCSSLNSQDPEVGSATYAYLARHYLAPPGLRTVPTPDFAFPLRTDGPAEVPVPRLLAIYLAIGARICGPPALDRQFKTIDFLTLLDLTALPSTAARKYLG